MVVSLPHCASSAGLLSGIPSSRDLHTSEDGELTIFHSDPS